MFTNSQIETIVSNELRAIIFLEGEDGGVFLNMDGFADSETDEGDYYNESDVHPEFFESLKEEVKQIETNPVLRKAFESYTEQTKLRATETLESRFGFDLGAERINGLGFGEAGLDEETAQTLVDWVENLGSPELFATDNSQLSGLIN